MTVNVTPYQFIGRPEEPEGQDERESSAKDGQDWHWLPETPWCILQMANQTKDDHTWRPVLWGKTAKCKYSLT